MCQPQEELIKIYQMARKYLTVILVEYILFLLRGDSMGDTVKTSEVIDKLKENNFCFVKHKTNHDSWYSPISNSYFMVPRHPKMPRITALDIYKQAGIK